MGGDIVENIHFPHDTPIAKGKNAAVLGGGNVAMDSARTALRLGADNVYIVYRRSKKELPARIGEVHHAEEEGVQFHFLTLPVKMLGNEDGYSTLSLSFSLNIILTDPCL